MAGLKANISHGWKYCGKGYTSNPHRELRLLGLPPHRRDDSATCRRYCDHYDLRHGRFPQVVCCPLPRSGRSQDSPSQLFRAFSGRGPEGRSVKCPWNWSGQRVPLVLPYRTSVDLLRYSCVDKLPLRHKVKAETSAESEAVEAQSVSTDKQASS